MTTPVPRRDFLKQAALLSAAGIVLLRPQAWAARGSAEATARLVVVFLRGAVDGLSVVVPHGESPYYDARPTIAVPRSGEGAVLDLDGHFGLHPTLAPLLPAWHDGSLAFVHACGSPDPTRSHFDAQDYMESGTPGVKKTPDGWMNRVLEALPGAPSPTEALSLGPVVPRILAGRRPVANIPLGRAATRPMPLDREVIAAAFDRLYTGDDPLASAYREGRAARTRLLAELQEDVQQADNGAPSPVGFPDDARRLARLIERDPSIRLAFLALGGWDTHVRQGASTGQLAGHLRPLAEGLAAFRTALGPAYADTVILVVSEFGRTVRENGNGGTDHGHGNVMWVMGASVRGGKVYGRWPGLAPDDLYEGRDLAVTTDFREVVSAVLGSHLRLTSSALHRVFPARPKPTGSISTLIKT
jgi:uncharacterized protein (DUF1501 family)